MIVREGDRLRHFQTDSDPPSDHSRTRSASELLEQG